MPTDRSTQRPTVRRTRARSTWLGVAVLSLLMVALAGCWGNPTSDSTESGVREGINLADELRVWVSTVGLAQMEPDVWRVRFEEICASRTGAGSAGIAALATRYIAEDADLSVRSAGDLPTVSEGVDSLLLIAGSVCQR